MKKLYKTKTFWGSVATIVTGIGLAVSGDTATGLQTVFTGILAIFTRDAISKGG